MPRVNPEILAWARVTAGISVDDAVRKLQIKDARGVSATERLAELESGAATPSRALLVRMAKQYRRPLLTFYLSAPPTRGNRGEDFRTIRDGQIPADEPLLDALLRDIQLRQRIVRAELEEDDDITVANWMGSISIEGGIDRATEAIENWLPMDIADFRAKPTPSEAFGVLRSSAESMGVFVLLIGDLGSHHTAIDVHTYRGFALADEIAPFVVINDNDSQAAWSFTLLHELTHIWLGQTGVSAFNGQNRTEKFCNDVASKLLLKDEDLDSLVVTNWSDLGSAATEIAAFASERNVSGSMVAYRLYSRGTIDVRTWNAIARFYRDQWLQSRRANREALRSHDGGPNWYVIRHHRLGRSLVGTVARMMRSGSITTTKAGQVLGLKAKQVEPLLDVYFAR